RFSPNPGTEATVKAITRDDVAGFYRRLYHPANASFVVVGDTTPDAITAALDKAFGAWPRGEPATVKLPEPPEPPKGITVALVDKPGAPQSFLAVGQVGAARRTPDHVPLSVFNETLGGQFSSRINLNLREDKGYTYGAFSAFAFRLGPGPFIAGAAVQ